MDTYAEQLIVRKNTGGTRIAEILLGGGCAALSLFFLYLSVKYLSILLIVVIGIVYGGYYLITGFYVEYEYQLTNGELDIDKIIGKRRRERLLSVKISVFEAYGTYADAPDVPDDCVTALAYDGEDALAFYADFQHETHGRMRLIFSPDATMRETMAPYLRKIRH